MFKDSEIKKAGLKDQISHLRQKHRGGENQKKGNRYEDYFSLFKITKNIYLHQKGEVQGVALIEQSENCFVDDLVIKKGSKTDFYQLKNTKTLSWNHRLLNDFEHQKVLCTSKGINFSLTLVVSQEKNFRKLISMPSLSYDKTFIKYFPEPRNIEDLIKNFEDFHFYLKEISAKRNPSLMDLDYLAKNILGEWIELSQKSRKFIELETLIRKSKRPSTPIKSKWIHSKEWLQAEKILNKIPNLTFFVDNGIFEYMYGDHDEGFFPAEPGSKELIRFLNRVKKNKPTTFNELEELF